MDLIVLESPNKVADVDRYARECGFNARVIATAGHLVDLPPMAQGPCVDVLHFQPEKLVPRDSRAKDRIVRLKREIAEADRVIVATDPDREGEAIAAQVWQLVPSGRAWRARFEEITSAGVARGLSNLQPYLDTHAVEASTVRRLVDRLAGWHATSLVFEKLPRHRGVSAGRLQSAALRLIVERFREHTAFVPSTTYGVRVRLSAGEGRELWASLMGQDDGAAVFSTADEARQASVPRTVRVARLECRKRREPPPPPFETTSWLQVAQKALGLSVQDAIAAAQSLFEGGRTTYPRTDSVRASHEAIEWARQELARRFGAELVPAEPWVHRDKASTVQGAHEAIRPTLTTSVAELEGRAAGSWGEAYALIEARFLASQSSAREVQDTAATLEGEGASLVARGQVELFAGWRQVLRTDCREEAAEAERHRASDERLDALPSLREGDTLEVVGTEVVARTSRPRPLFTQASLVAELKRRGIGRPSTYQSLVPRVLSRGWVEENIWPQKRTAGPSSHGRRPSLVPSEVGMELADFLGQALPGLVDYEFTAQLEAELDEIERGAGRREEIGRRWWVAFEAELQRARLLPARTAGPRDRPVRNGKSAGDAPCPECGRQMRHVRRRDGGHSLVCTKDGWFLADARWKVVISPPCPECRKPMLHRERSRTKGRFFWACFADRAFAEADVFGSIQGEITRKGDPTGPQ